VVFDLILKDEDRTTLSAKTDSAGRVLDPSFPQVISQGQPISAIVIFDIDGVVRDVAGSYRRALADTVEQFTGSAYRPTQTEIDSLKLEGFWNNDWEASQEMVYRYFEAQGCSRAAVDLNYEKLVAFFQSRYRGPTPQSWTGYIRDEPLLMSSRYLELLSRSGIFWGFFSGATRGSATYVLERRLGLQNPILVAMEDAPSKPNPTGLVAAVDQLEARYRAETHLPVLYVGDTVADLYTVQQVQAIHHSRAWIGVGIVPPHVQDRAGYADRLQQAGAVVVLENVEQLTPKSIFTLISSD